MPEHLGLRLTGPDVDWGGAVGTPGRLDDNLPDADIPPQSPPYPHPRRLKSDRRGLQQDPAVLACQVCRKVCGTVAG